MVARENGREGMAEVLREWVENKVRDLREKGVRGDEFGSSVRVGKERKACSTGALDTVV
jgi:hypothetical protein